VEAIEGEKTALEAELARPEVYANGERARAVQAKLKEAAAALEEKTAAWEALSAELAEYGKSQGGAD
jgi:ATP-binding cassette subfamily F protein 3